MRFGYSPVNPEGLMLYVTAAFIVYVACWLFLMVTEAHTIAVRMKLKGILCGRPLSR